MWIVFILAAVVLLVFAGGFFERDESGAGAFFFFLGLIALFVGGLGVYEKGFGEIAPEGRLKIGVPYRVAACDPQRDTDTKGPPVLLVTDGSGDELAVKVSGKCPPTEFVVVEVGRERRIVAYSPLTSEGDTTISNAGQDSARGRR